MEGPSRRSAPEAHGHLREINRHGAVFTLEREVCAGDRIVLYVHCLHPTEGRVRIRFPSVVTQVEQRDSWEVTVRFRRGHQFLLDSIDG